MWFTKAAGSGYPLMFWDTQIPVGPGAQSKALGTPVAPHPRGNYFLSLYSATHAGPIKHD